MASNLERFRADAMKLEADGLLLSLAMDFELLGEKAFKSKLAKQMGAKADSITLDKLPKFSRSYQVWYSNSRALIKALLPDRVADFVRLHEKPRNRKVASYGDYYMEDYLEGLRVTRPWTDEVVVDRSAAVAKFDQMRGILHAALQRLDTAVHDLQQMVQADIFDSELDAARGLLKMGFLRAAGAMAGVVIERHLAQVLEARGLKLKKPNPTIGDLSGKLKEEGVIDVAQWRHIQLLADIRNICDHNKAVEPKKDDLETLIGGSEKLIKTVF